MASLGGNGLAHGPKPVFWWPRRRSLVFDVAVTILSLPIPIAFLALYVYLVARPHSFGGVLPPSLSPTESVSGVLSFAYAFLTVPATLSLVLRRRFPTAVAVANVLTSSSASAFALYTLAAYGRRDRRGWRVLLSVSALAAVLPTVTTLVLSVGRPGVSLVVATFVVSAVAGVALPVVLGLYVNARRTLIANLRQESERLARERDLMVQKARAEERTRLAREMHDVVAHRVSLMVVHAGALRLAFGRTVPQAGQSAELIAAAGRQALDELRQIIGVLRMEDNAGAGPESREPMPNLADVEALVEECRAAGMSVELTVSGERPVLNPAAEHAAYRVVQEGLTNVRKHAGGAKACVRIGYREDGVDVSVDNDRPSQAEELELPSSGFGLVGLRERVSALGGTFSAGVRSDGGFGITAHLPGAPTAAGSVSMS